MLPKLTDGVMQRIEVILGNGPGPEVCGFFFVGVGGADGFGLGVGDEWEAGAGFVGEVVRGGLGGVVGILAGLGRRKRICVGLFFQFEYRERVFTR